jgi:SagB-type dehydrogenase family enzyme
MGMNGPVLPPFLRRAEGFVLRVTGLDASVELPGAPPILLPNQAWRLVLLWDLLDAPCTLREILAALDAEAAQLLERLLDAGVLLPWPLTSELADVHRATTTPSITAGIMAGSEDARLLREHTGEDGFDLPAPVLSVDLAAALVARRTVRDFAGIPLSLADLSALLAFGAGSATRPAIPSTAGGPPGARTYPSGGGLYPIEILVLPILVDGLESIYYRYQVLSHRLVQIRTDRRVWPAMECMLVENGIVGPSVVLLLWVDFTRPSFGKYGKKTYRLALLEAGHIAQNLLLIAAGLGLAGIPLCGFDDQALAEEAGLTFPDRPVVYVITLGGSRSPESRP